MGSCAGGYGFCNQCQRITRRSFSYGKIFINRITRVFHHAFIEGNDRIGLFPWYHHIYLTVVSKKRANDANMSLLRSRRFCWRFRSTYGKYLMILYLVWRRHEKQSAVESNALLCSRRMASLKYKTLIIYVIGSGTSCFTAYRSFLLVLSPIFFSTAYPVLFNVRVEPEKML